MLAPHHRPAAPTPDLSAALAAALARIPPLWPLERFVAVNPFLGFAARPFADAAHTLLRVAGAAPLQGLAAYREAWRTGLITSRDLLEAADAEWSPSALLAALSRPGKPSPAAPLCTVADFLDRETPPAQWSRLVVEEISKWCAVYFDENQTTWTMPWKHEGLYAAWRAAAVHDRNPEALGLRGFRAWVARLPESPVAAIAACVSELGREGDELADFLHRQLLTIAGWAGHVQYRVREDALRGRANAQLAELLAIRLAYDTALFHSIAHDPALRARWRSLESPVAERRHVAALARWQSAYEAGYQRRLAQSLAAQPASPPAGRPAFQAVFCIDVRSEILRRQLERALPGARTLGFAGFFGFPVAHRAAADAAPAALCPALLVPPVASSEPLSPTESARARAGRAASGAWKAFQNSAASCFSFVESVGLGFGLALGRAAAPSRLRCARVAPRFAEASLETRARLAAGALRGMSLVRDHARLILLCGHGSDSANNPHASGLDCGACGGHAGEINARLAAATLNDPEVRALLAREGLALPADTVFIAGLHNTTTDDVVLFDLDQLPASHREEAARLRAALGLASAAARLERAPRLGLAGSPPERLAAALRARAAAVAELRPEWGLANNAALVAAPRSRTAALDLEGRVFLHDYDASTDPDDQILTLILSARVVVASWINLQYYASRIDPARYGAGDKILHNVVGGLGVVEGNGGDLKVGLPLQSLHDGHAFTHEPRRLAVYLQADPARISAVLQKNPAIHQLFAHEWLHLFALHGQDYLRYKNGRWLKGSRLA